MRLRDRLNKPEYVFRPLQLARRLCRGWRRLPDTAVVHLPWSLSIGCNPKDDIGRAIWLLGIYDLPVTELIWRLLDPGEWGVDVGANIGYMTCVMAKCVGSLGRVWSFEPHPGVFADLEANVARWKTAPAVGQIQPYRIALSDQSGQASLVEPVNFAANRGTASLAGGGVLPLATGPHRPIGVVDTMRLDDLFPSTAQVGLAKIDVEGHELAVLDGAKQVLQRGGIRDIIFEDHGPYPTPVALRFREHGYSLFRLSKGLLGPRLKAPVEASSETAWLPPNFLATLDPQRVQARVAPRGWMVLREIH